MVVSYPRGEGDLEETGQAQVVSPVENEDGRTDGAAALSPRSPNRDLTVLLSQKRTLKPAHRESPGEHQ